jgi:hypothetical protein
MWRESVAPLRDALEHYRKDPQGVGVTGQLVPHLIDSMLASQEYQQLTGLAQDLLANSDSVDLKRYHQDIGSAIRTEAEQLRNRREYDRASALITTALKMNPPLDRFYVEQLQQLQKQIAQERPRQPR